MSNGEVLIRVENVSKKFCGRLKRGLWYGMKDLTSEILGRSDSHNELRKDEFWAVKDVSLELRRGECLGLIGRNGAGKSTLLKMLNGLIKLDEGRLTVRGRVGALIELGAGFSPILTGRENIYINAAVLGIPKEEVDKRLESIIEFAEIEDFIDTPVQHYSSGMKVRLGFAVAAQLEPDVLLIDEVLAVGDLGFKIKCLNEIHELVKRSAVILVSHSMQAILRICTQVMVLENGKLEYHENDVAVGVDYYHRKFEGPGQITFGTDKATVSDVVLSSGHQHAKGKKMLLLDYEADLSIQMTLGLDSSIREPAIWIIIYSQELRPVASCFTQHCGFEINPKRLTRIKLRLRDLRLNMGVYSITVGVVSLSKNEALARYDNIAHFQAKCTCLGMAPILLKGKWEQDELRQD